MLNKQINSKLINKFTQPLLNFSKSVKPSFSTMSFIHKNQSPLYSVKSNHFNLNKHLYKFQRNCFTENKNEKPEETESSTSKETKDSTNNTNTEEKEDTISLKKYNLLKELYEDSESNLEKARSKFDELRKGYISTQSDLERIRKRSEIEIAQAKEFAITKFAKDILDVYDNFERALASIKEVDSSESAEDKIQTYKNFSEGVEITKDSLTRILGVHGVKEYNPLKEKFDPSKHDAVFQSVSSEIPIGSISDVMQTGFTIGTRILRPAKVGVVKSKQ